MTAEHTLSLPVCLPACLRALQVFVNPKDANNRDITWHNSVALEGYVKRLSVVAVRAVDAFAAGIAIRLLTASGVTAAGLKIPGVIGFWLSWPVCVCVRAGAPGCVQPPAEAVAPGAGRQGGGPHVHRPGQAQGQVSSLATCLAGCSAVRMDPGAACHKTHTALFSLVTSILLPT